MILVDTTPLVALCDPTDGLHARARRDIDRLSRQPLVVPDPVLTEALHLLPHRPQRDRIAALVRELGMRPWSIDDPDRFRAEVFHWLDRYSDHVPDWADATLVIAAARTKRARVWTYDREFRSIWRRPDGTRVPLFPR